jgi:hypothetical protein
MENKRKLEEYKQAKTKKRLEEDEQDKAEAEEMRKTNAIKAAKKAPA